MSQANENSVQNAIQVAQNSTTGQIDPQSRQILETYLNRVWARIQAEPNTYVMTALEFAVFNRYRARPRYQNSTAQKAVQRYWNNHSARDGSSH